MNSETENYEETSFWNKTIIGIPVWLIILVIIIIIIYLIFKAGSFSSNSHANPSNVSFANKTALAPVQVTPVSEAVPVFQAGQPVQVYPTTLPPVRVA